MEPLEAKCTGTSLEPVRKEVQAAHVTLIVCLDTVGDSVLGVLGERVDEFVQDIRVVSDHVEQTISVEYLKCVAHGIPLCGPVMTSSAGPHPERTRRGPSYGHNSLSQ